MTQVPTHRLQERELEEVEAALAELEVDVALLRANPGGEGWLPAPLRERAASEPEVAALVREFVEMELELGGALGRGELDGAPVHRPEDALFTREVVEALPDERGHRWRRTLVLATCHALALGAFWLIWGSAHGQDFVASSRGTVQGAFEGLRGSELPAAVTLVVVAALLFAWPTLSGGRGDRTPV